MNLAPMRLAAACLVGAVLLTGCSDGDAGGTTTAAASPTPNGFATQPAATILETARTAARAQSSVHLTGSGSCPKAPFVADLRLRSDGQGAGTVTMFASTIDLVSTPDALYLRAPQGFWEAQTTKEKAASIGTKWVKLTPAANPCMTALGSFSAVMDNYLGWPGTPTKEKSNAVHGVPAQLLLLPPDVSFWVATTGNPLPVFVGEDTLNTKITFGEWGAPVEVVVPPENDVIDGSTLA